MSCFINQQDISTVNEPREAINALSVCAAVGRRDRDTHSDAGSAQQGGAGRVLRLRRAAHRDRLCRR